MRVQRRIAALAVMACAAIAAFAPAANAWAPADSATVHPGVQTFTDGAQCTANFVFSDGTTTYLGQAGDLAGDDSLRRQGVREEAKADAKEDLERAHDQVEEQALRVRDAEVDAERGT
jgi:uncharacterized protein YjbJ (UPF0337 family)